ncbi:membrane protein [Bacteroidia bacterium]|nr:membrane protein [Bacteroidia bacterium]
MNTFKRILVACLLTAAHCPVICAQSANTNSSYTRYGYGQLADPSVASQRGMGGIGYGLRNPKNINPLNPAAFSAVDSMTFMLDFGLRGQVGFFDDNGNKNMRWNAGLEYIAVQFPVSKKIGIGAGIEPVSYVGYKYGNSETSSVPGNTTYKQYEGSGGINKFYGNIAYEFNRLSAGVKIGYMFGDITHSSTSSFSSSSIDRTTWSDSLHASGLSLNFGLQYRHPLSNNTEVVIGAVFAPQMNLNSRYSTSEIQYSSAGTITNDPKYSGDLNQRFQMPSTFGIGATYHKYNKYTVGADLTFQNWASAQFGGKTDTLTNRLKINLGGEYVHTLHYRAGAYYSGSYFETANGSGYDEYGVSIGVGIPMLDRRSYLNFAVGGEMLRPKVSGMINEYYVKFTVSYTFNELWFRKRKML